MVSQLPGFERRTLLQADSCQRSAVRCDQTFSALKVAQCTEPHLDFFYVVTREGLGDLLRLMHGDYLSQDVRSVIRDGLEALIVPDDFRDAQVQSRRDGDCGVLLPSTEIQLHIIKDSFTSYHNFLSEKSSRSGFRLCYRTIISLPIPCSQGR